MNYKAAIFDMDGLLIDSEPLWQEAGIETLRKFGIELTIEQYHTSTGLRTEEWIEHWFHIFGISMEYAPEATSTIIRKSIEKIDERGVVFTGVNYIFDFFRQQQFKIAIATSSPLALVDVVVKKLNTGFAFDAITSAEHLPYGKPHPMVFLNCAKDLEVRPMECIVFEDSFNGMIAAKAAKMKCVVIPAIAEQSNQKWGAADIQLKQLDHFSADILNGL